MKFLQNLSITIKILIPPAVLVLALVAVFLTALYGLNFQRKTLDEINDIALNKIRLVDEFIALSEQVQSDVFRISVLRFMELPDEEIMPIQARMEQGLSDLNVIYGQILAEWLLDEQEQALVAQMKEPLDAFRQQAQQAVATVSDNPSFGVVLVHSATIPFAEFRSILAEFLDYQQAKIAHARAEANQRATAVSTIILTLALGISLIGIVSAVLVSNYLIAQPIRAMTDLMGQLAAGDMSVEVGDLKRRDEIGGMARALEVFRQNAVEKVQAEEALRKSNAKHTAMIENIGDVIAIVGADGMTKYQSPNIEKWFGWKPEDLIGTNGWDKMHPEDIERIQKELSEMLKKETASIVEYRFRCKEGNYKWIELTGVNRINEPAINGVLLNYHDITERKKADEELKKNLTSLQQAEVLAQLGYFERNWQTSEGYWSEGFFKLLGINEKSETLSHKDFTQFIHPDDFERVTGHIRKTLSEHIPMNIEFRLVQATGQIIHIHGTAENYYDQNDKPTLTVGVFQDITNQIESQKELVESEKKLREAQEMAHLGFWSWDVQTGEVEWSEEVFNIFGLDPDTFTPQIDSILALSPWPEDHNRNTELINHAVESHAPGHYEQKFLRPDKSIGHYYSTFQGKYDENGELVLMVGTVLDITERKQAEAALQEYSERQEEMVEERTRELREAQEQLVRKEKLAILGELAGSVAHELRNPLGVLTNSIYFLNIILTDADEKTKEYLDIISSEIHKSERIVTDLLGFSRTRLTEETEREEVAVSALVTRVLAEQPPPDSVEVSTQFDPDLPPALVNPQQIGQVLTNLITNAYQAMPNGGKLTVSAETDGNEVKLNVADTGQGIPPENLDKLFEPLFTTKAKGIGLGLAVSKNLAEANGGTIKVQSVEGKGSTFTLTLPSNGEIE